MMMMMACAASRMAPTTTRRVNDLVSDRRRPIVRGRRLVRITAAASSRGASNGGSDDDRSPKPDEDGNDAVSNASSSADPSEDASSNPGDSGGSASLESQFMRVLREQEARARREMETRWKQGGLRPRVVHESTSDYIRRVDFQWPTAVLGTASGAVLVSNCEECGGLEYRERARRLIARAPDAHARDWTGADDRGLGERSLLGLYDGGAVTAVAIAEDVVASGGRDGKLRVWRIPDEADVDSPSHPPGGLPLEAIGTGEHPNVVTAIAMDPATGSMWTSCLDGHVRRWTVVENGPADDGGGATDDSETVRLTGQWATGQPALCASLCGEDRVVYVGTADGTALAFDAGEAGRHAADVESATSARELCRWRAHDGGATRSVEGTPGGCVTGSSTGPIMAWRWTKPPTAAAAAFHGGRGPPTVDEGARKEDGATPVPPPVLVSKLLGHTQACVALSCGNPKHVVSGAHDGTVRVWDMPRLAGRYGEQTEDNGRAGVINDAFLDDASTSGDDASWDRDGSEGGGSGGGGDFGVGGFGGFPSTSDAASSSSDDAAAPPVVERREALYAVTGHTVWLGGLTCDDTRILCDGANNIAMMYDYSDDPDGDGDI